MVFALAKNLKLIFFNPFLFLKIKVIPFAYFQLFYKHNILTKTIRTLLFGRDVMQLNKNIKLGVLNFRTDQWFYKVEILSNSMDLEIENRKMILINFPELGHLLPEIKEFNILGFRIFKCPLLMPLDKNNQRELIEGVSFFLRKFKKYSQKILINNVERFKEVSIGLRIVRDVLGDNAINNIEERINLIFKKELRIGPAHGDFHHLNILKDNKGNFFLIDFDCFRKTGIQEIDLIYFLLEFEHSKKSVRKFWIMEGMDFLKNPSINMNFKNICDEFIVVNTKDLILLYIIDRMGQEYKFNSNKEMYNFKVTALVNNLNTLIQN